jgi:hypothetical protein
MKMKMNVDITLKMFINVSIIFSFYFCLDDIFVKQIYAQESSSENSSLDPSIYNQTSTVRNVGANEKSNDVEKFLIDDFPQYSKYANWGIQGMKILLKALEKGVTDAFPECKWKEPILNALGMFTTVALYMRLISMLQNLIMNDAIIRKMENKIDEELLKIRELLKIHKSNNLQAYNEKVAIYDPSKTMVQTQKDFFNYFLMEQEEAYRAAYIDVTTDTLDLANSFSELVILIASDIKAHLSNPIYRCERAAIPGT